MSTQQQDPSSNHVSLAENVANGASQQHSLPPNTFVVGVAAFERSARAGRRFLNYELSRQMIEQLQAPLPEEERDQLADTVATRLNSLLSRVQGALDGLSTRIAPLAAFARAEKVRAPVGGIFTGKRFSFSFGPRTLSDLRQYVAHLAQTYQGDDAQLQGRSQTGAQSASLPSLQDALNSRSEIQRTIEELEGKDPARHLAEPVLPALLEAKRLVSQPPLFRGDHGAITRARLHLQALAEAAADRWLHHKQSLPDLKARREALTQRGNDQIQDLQEHVERWPLAKLPGVKPLLAILTMLLICFLTFGGLVTGFSSLHQLLLEKQDSFASVMTTPTLLGVLGSALLAVWGLVGPKLLKKNRSALQVEATFKGILAAFLPMGALVKSAPAALGDDPVSADILSVQSFLPTLAWIALAVLVLALIAEISYTIWWFGHIRAERDDIQAQLAARHRQDCEAVAQFFAEEMALQLLQSAQIIDEHGNAGKYAERIDHLSSLLDQMREEARGQHDLARAQLQTNLSEIEPGTPPTEYGPTLNPQTRQELLNPQALTDGYARLKEALAHHMPEAEWLAEALVQGMGGETPPQIEAELRRRTMQGDRSYHTEQALTIALVALALRAAINAPLPASNLPLRQRYQEVSRDVAYPLPMLDTLLGLLEKHATEATLQPLNIASGLTGPHWEVDLGLKALMIWSQSLWEHRKTLQEKPLGLSKALAPTGVVPAIREEGYETKVVAWLLALRTSLSGRGLYPGQPGKFTLLAPLSPKGDTFMEDLQFQGRKVLDFPDHERLILVYEQHYISPPTPVSRQQLAPQLTPAHPSALPELAAGAAPPAAANGAANGQPGPASATPGQSATPAGPDAETL